MNFIDLLGNTFRQGNLVKMVSFAKYNKGYNYILVVSNIFTQYVWREPFKTKTGTEVVKAFEKVLVPKKLYIKKCIN